MSNKFEFVKETLPGGATIYYTNKDGYYVSNSLSLEKEKAYELYKNLINETTKPKIETLEVTIVDSDSFINN